LEWFLLLLIDMNNINQFELIEMKRDEKKAGSLLTVKEASNWASEYLGKNITPSNISYLIQYGRIPKISINGTTQVSTKDLIEYYRSYNGNREIEFKNKLGDDLNWALSFDQYKEAETTKHVHRLHPYKGKFIPQLVEYFLDDHTDAFKKEVYFRKNDVVLDPFSGSGTTVIQACELGIHGIGIDVSAFNTLIGNCKISKYDLPKIQSEIYRITNALKKFLSQTNTIKFYIRLLLSIDLGVPGRHAVDMQNINFHLRMLNNRPQLLIAHLPPLIPQPRPADGVVQIAIKGDGGLERRCNFYL